MGGQPLSDTLSLEAAGLDSLRLLQFVLALERALGRQIPLDLLDSEMRAEDVVAALSRDVPAGPPIDARPTVFLMPGLDDDEQRLARFRVALRQQVRFVLATYPDWPEMLRPGWGLADLIGCVAEQVRVQAAGAPVLLTGYSFGGEVAFWVACRLRGQGYPVRWLGILDTDITRVPPPPSGGPVARLKRYAREMAADIRSEGVHKSAGLLAAKLARQGRGPLRLGNPGRWSRWMPARTAFWFHRRTRSVLRIEALWAWLAAGAQPTLPVPVSLFRSQAGAGISPPDLGWAPRCPALTIVPVSGNHHTLFDSPHREILYARYAETVRHLTTAPQPAKAA